VTSQEIQLDKSSLSAAGISIVSWPAFAAAAHTAQPFDVSGAFLRRPFSIGMYGNRAYFPRSAAK